MQATVSIEVGQDAPDYKLKGPGGQFVTLSEYRGKKNVVLVFFPLAFSPVCSHQLPSIEKQMDRFRGLDAEVFGISVDSHYANEGVRQAARRASLYSPTSRAETSQAYGIFLPERLYSGRAVFLIDRRGKIAYKDISPTLGDVPSNEAVLQALTSVS